MLLHSTCIYMYMDVSCKLECLFHCLCMYCTYVALTAIASHGLTPAVYDVYCSSCSYVFHYYCYTHGVDPAVCDVHIYIACLIENGTERNRNR